MGKSLEKRIEERLLQIHEASKRVKKKEWERVINQASDPELEYMVTMQDLKCFPRESELEVMTLHEIGQYLLDLLTLAECSAEEQVKWEIQELAHLAVREVFKQNR